MGIAVTNDAGMKKLVKAMRWKEWTYIPVEAFELVSLRKDDDVGHIESGL